MEGTLRINIAGLVEFSTGVRNTKDLDEALEYFNITEATRKELVAYAVFSSKRVTDKQVESS